MYLLIQLLKQQEIIKFSSYQMQHVNILNVTKALSDYFDITFHLPKSL